MSQTKTLTAREAYHDALKFFEEIRQDINHGLVEQTTAVRFTERLEPEEEFQIRLKATHATLAMFVARYRAADFTFHSERIPIDRYPDRTHRNYPLVTHYAEFTIDFTPYGTVFGSYSDDDGGNATQHSCSQESTPTPAEPQGPTSPTATAGPGTNQTGPVQSVA